MTSLIINTNQNLKKAARLCIVGRDLGGMLGQRLSFTYTLGIANDTARVDDVTKVNSDVEDPDIESCILERIETLEWRAEDLVPAEKSLRGSVKLGDL